MFSFFSESFELDVVRVFPLLSLTPGPTLSLTLLCTGSSNVRVAFTSRRSTGAGGPLEAFLFRPSRGRHGNRLFLVSFVVIDRRRDARVCTVPRAERRVQKSQTREIYALPFSRSSPALLSRAATRRSQGDANDADERGRENVGLPRQPRLMLLWETQPRDEHG